MNPILQKDILTETYYDVIGLIIETAKTAHKTLGGDLDDLIAQANLIFIEAVHSHKKNTAPFLAWLILQIKWGLFNYMKKQWHQTNQIQQNPTQTKLCSAIETLDELSKDAITIIKLFAEIPKETLSNIINTNTHRRGPKPLNVHRRLRNRLRQEGWTPKQTKYAFDELKQALTH